MTASTASALFDQRYDLDYYKVSLVAGQRYLFKMTPAAITTGTQRPALELFAPGSPDTGFNPAAGDTRVLLFSENADAAFAFVADQTGTYYLRASQSPINTVPRVDSGSYTVSVEGIALDDHSDLPAQGTPLSLGAALPGQFDQRHDKDFFRIDLAQGQRVLFTMNGSGGTPVINNALQILSPDGHLLASDSHASESGGAKIAFVAPAAGSYQVLAQAWESTTGTGNELATGGYTLAASSLAADDHADLPAQGTALAVGASLAGAFDQRHDLDYFRVNLTAGQRYLFSMNGAGGNPLLGSDIALLGPDGQPIKTLEDPLDDSNTTTNGGAKFSYVARESGTHFLLATLGTGNANGDTGSYQVSLASLSADDHADLQAQGTPLALGATANGQFDQRYDLDWFKVNLVAGQRYTFTMAAGASNGIKSAMLSLTDPDGLSYKIDFGIDMSAQIPDALKPFLPAGFGTAEAKFVYTATQTGTHYLLAQAAQTYAAVGVATGSYTLRAAGIAADDHPDHWEQAELLNAGATVNGTFDFRHDEDYFKVNLSAGQRYLFTLTPTSGGTTDIVSMVLFTTAQTQLGYDISSSGTDPAKFSYVAPSSGTYYLRLEGQQAFSLGGAVTQSYSLRYSSIALDDVTDLREQASLLFQAVAPNRAPEVANGSASTDEDTPLAGLLPAASDADGDTPVYAKASEPAHGSLSISADGHYSYTPSADYAGSDSFDFSVSDGKGGSVTRTMSLSVVARNDAPVVAHAPADQQVAGGSAYAFTLPADTFSDVDGPALAYSATRADGSALPDWLHFDAATRQFSGTPANTDVGTLALRITASDGTASASVTYTLQVLRGANQAPSAADGSAQGSEDAVLSGQLPAASDADHDPIHYTLVSQAAHGEVVVEADGRFQYTPSADFHGSDSFVFRVSDDQGGSQDHVQSLSVAAVNDAPTGAVALSGTPTVGERLTASHGLADADGLGPISWQWFRGEVPIEGATSADYLLGEADVGQALRVQASYTDGGGQLEHVSSSATAAVEQAVHTITGGNGIDHLTGTEGRDSLVGGPSNDVLAGSPGADTLDGGAGTDIANYAGQLPVSVDLRAGTATQGSEVDTLVGIEAVFGSALGDVLRGRDGAENLRDDSFRGSGGNDTIDGGTGVDTAEWLGARSDYAITRLDDTHWSVRDANLANGDEGTDTISSIERLQFADQLVAFGTRAEDIARVASVLWSPAIFSIPAFSSLFARGFSFYDVGYGFAFMSEVALQFWTGDTDAQLAQRLRDNSHTSSTTAQLLAIASAAGGGDAGRAAMVRAAADDPANLAILEASGVKTTGIVADNAVAGFGTLFELLPA